MGKTVFILGAGTSLNFCIKYSKFNQIYNHVVVSVNSSILALNLSKINSNNTYWISNDSICRYWSYFPKVKNSKCTKIVRDSWMKYEKELEGFLYFWPRKTSEDIINEDEIALCYCSSCISAIDLSIQMGCKKIFLLGVDHYEVDEKTHFWEFLPKTEQPFGPKSPYSQQKSVFEFNNLAFKALLGFAKKRNVEIFNCNPMSKVEVFQKIEFENVWIKINEN
jgi:hypothetical protein